MFKKSIFIIVALSIAVSVVIYWNYTTSPRYSLAQIRKSIQEHDKTSFEKYVDVESLTSNLIDDVLNTTAKDVPKNEAEMLAESAGKGFVELLKPKLVQVAKQKLVNYVEAGDLEKKENTQSHNSPSFSLSNFWNTSGGSKSEIKGIKYVKKEGKIAYVGMILFNKDYNADIILDLKMRNRVKYWQLIELSNYKDYIKKIDELESKRIKELNAPITKKIAQTLNTEYFQTKNIVGPFGIDKKIIFILDLKNVGDKEIDEYKINLTCSTIDGKASKNVEFAYRSNIMPGNIAKGSWSVPINAFSQNDKILFEAPQRNLKVDGEVEYVKFADGTELKLFKKYGGRK